MEGFEGLGAALYLYGEVHKAYDRLNKSTGEMKYYVRLLVDDEPGVIAVNITELTQDEIVYLAKHPREMVLLRVRCFAMEGNLYYKATEFMNGSSVAAGASVSILADSGS